MTYPQVADEFETIRRIRKGRSLARYGDGELKIMGHHVIAYEPERQPALAAELRRIARRPHKNCLIGIPTMDPAGSRYENFKGYRSRFMAWFNNQTRHKYVSAFISRPDCHERLETREYYEAVISIWAGKRRIALVAPEDSALLAYLCMTHPVGVWHVTCPPIGAYAEIDRLEREVMEGESDIALLSCGPTATALAHRLTLQGLQAIDIGSIGGFLLRWHENRPRPTNDQEYKAERDGPETNSASAAKFSGQGQSQAALP